MEDVDTQSHGCKVWVRLHMLSEQAIVVKKEMVGFDRVPPECMLDEFLVALDMINRGQ